ncbi:MAG: hypothetical protein ACRCXZ_10565 [Patescibacteria group bacterium]
MKKNAVIVSGFSVLVIVMMAFAFYTANNKESKNEIRATSSFESEIAKTLTIPVKKEKKALIVVGERVVDPNDKTEEDLKKSFQELKDKENKTQEKVTSDQKPDEYTYIAPEENDTNKGQVVINNPISAPVDPYLWEDDFVNNDVQSPSQPLPELKPAPYVAPSPEPTPELTPSPQPNNPAPSTSPRQKYEESMSRLSTRGSEVIVPIANNNIFLLDFSKDTDLNYVLSYEYELNKNKKSYSVYGSKTHLDTLKCERYIAGCKFILRKGGTGRYYLNLTNLRFYTK